MVGLAVSALLRSGLDLGLAEQMAHCQDELLLSAFALAVIFCSVFVESKLLAVVAWSNGSYFDFDSIKRFVDVGTAAALVLSIPRIMDSMSDGLLVFVIVLFAYSLSLVEFFAGLVQGEVYQLLTGVVSFVAAMFAFEPAAMLILWVVFVGAAFLRIRRGRCSLREVAAVAFQPAVYSILGLTMAFTECFMDLSPTSIAVGLVVFALFKFFTVFQLARALQIGG